VPVNVVGELQRILPDLQVFESPNIPHTTLTRMPLRGFGNPEYGDCRNREGISADRIGAAIPVRYSIFDF
jgi:hypothetical protein